MKFKNKKTGEVLILTSPTTINSYKANSDYIVVTENKKPETQNTNENKNKE